MRFGIGAKLGVLASVLIIVTVLILAGLLMGWSKDIVIRRSRETLADETQLRGKELPTTIQALREDVLRQAARPEIQELLRPSPSRPQVLRDRVEEGFRATLSEPERPAYLHLEFIPLGQSSHARVSASRMEKQKLQVKN